MRNLLVFVCRALLAVALASIVTVAWRFATPPELQGDLRCLFVYAITAGSLTWKALTDNSMISMMKAKD